MSISTGVKKAWRKAQQQDFVQAFRLLWMHGKDMNLIAPSSLVLDNGTSANALADLQTMLDGNIYQIAEVAGAPGQTLTLTFTGVNEIYGFMIRAYYTGSSTHYCEVQLYNYTTASWDVFITVETSNGYNVRYIRVPNDADYISNSQAQVRWTHPVSGNASHNAYIDFVALEG